MTTHQVRKKRQAGGERRSPAKQLRRPNPERLALPQDEIRLLVARSTTRYKIEPFVRPMVRVMDDLKAGRIRKAARLTVSSRDQSRAILITVISKAAREGKTLAAHETAFLAALYAYENSLDHLRAFLGYPSGFRRHDRKRDASRMKVKIKESPTREVAGKP